MKRRLLAGLLAAVVAVTTGMPCSYAADSPEAGAKDIPDVTPEVTPRGTDIPLTEEFFPDEVFREYLAENVDTGYWTSDSEGDDIFIGENDGYLSLEERARVTEINVSYKGISNLTGIKYFPDLTYLDCSSNNLSELDVSSRQALIWLYCSHNNLSELDVSSCSALGVLDCARNNLSKLDVSSCSTLRDLTCYKNNLSELNVSNCPALEILDCDNNNLSELDASNCPALERLWCYNNNLSSLDVSSCPALKRLECGYNNLSGLDVSSCPALKGLWCRENNLSELDVSSCPALESMDCSDNNLSSLDLSNNGLICDFAGEQFRYINSKWLIRTEEGWQYDLSSLVGQDNIANVTSVGGDTYWSEEGERIPGRDATMSNGIVTFSGTDQPYNFIYSYDTGGGYDLSVTLYFGGNSPEDCDHAWDAGAVTKPATDTTDEVTTFTCEECGETLSVTLTEVNFVYDGKKKAVKPVIYDSSGTIVDMVTSIVYGSADMADVTYSGPPANAGNYACTISVLGKYNLVCHRKIVIEPANIDPLMSSVADSSFIYDGRKKETNMLIKDFDYHVLEREKDYKVAYSPDNVNAGIVNVTVTGIGNYKGTKTGSFRIVPQSVTSQYVELSDASYICDGRAHRPTVTAYNRYTGKALSASDYTVTYSGDGSKPGIYVVTVKFKGNYQGSVKKTYTVSLAGTRLKSIKSKSKGFTAVWGKSAQKVDGYQVQYSTSKKFTQKTTGTRTVKGYKKNSLTLKKLKGKKKYYVRIRTCRTISGKKSYSSWSKAKTVTTK